MLPLGQARTVRAGRDVTLVGLSITVGTCLAAADELAAEGIEAEVIDLRTLVPLDAAAVLGSVARTRRLVVVEENPGQLGWGASVAAIAAAGGVRRPGRPGDPGQRRQRAAAGGCLPGGRGGRVGGPGRRARIRGGRRQAGRLDASSSGRQVTGMRATQ